MKPEEKAFELAHKFRLIDIRTSESTTMMISMTDAKQCALIAVDEILQSLGHKKLSDSPYTTLEARQYYVQVKQEIESL